MYRILREMYGPARLFVWMAAAFLEWFNAVREPSEIWKRFVQECRIAHGIRDEQFEGWLRVRRSLGYRELPVEKWMRRKGRIA